MKCNKKERFSGRYKAFLLHHFSPRFRLYRNVPRFYDIPLRCIFRSAIFIRACGSGSVATGYPREILVSLISSLSKTTIVKNDRVCVKGIKKKKTEKENPRIRKDLTFCYMSEISHFVQTVIFTVSAFKSQLLSVNK